MVYLYLYMLLLLLNTVRQEEELNACYDSVYRKILGFNKWKSVKCNIRGLGRLDFHRIVRIRHMKFYFHILRVKHTQLNNI